MDNEIIAYSQEMQEVKKLIALVKGLSVNTIIMGDEGVGKSLAAKAILPNAIALSGEKPEEALKALKSFDEAIIEDFDKLPNPDTPIFNGKKIVATSRKKIKDGFVDRIFGVKIEIPPLSQRQADVNALVEHFLKMAKKELNIDAKVELYSVTKDISQNAHSLKRGAYEALLCASATKEKLSSVMEEYFLAHIEDTNENYKLFLDIFDSAIINANHKKYKSQLMMSYKMGINRNTLRKKIIGLGKKLDDE